MYVKFAFLLLCINFSVELFSNDLPKCIIIGAQKSGTGAFYALLRQHPQIVDRPGEIHFFDLHYNKGIEWYKAQFPPSADSKNFRMDKSPYYLFHPLVPERVHALLPDVKLIIILRNPVDRAYSHYWMNVRNKKEILSFADAIKAEQNRISELEEEIIATGNTSPTSPHRIHSYLSRGYYFKQLSRWLKFFSIEQLHIISFSEFLENPAQVMREVLEFLELPDNDFDFKQRVTSTYPSMDAALRKELSDYYRQYNEELELLVNKKFNWK